MNDPVTADLFVEDRAHEEFLRAAIRRLAREEGKRIRIRPRSARGGHGRAIAELKLYQAAVRSGLLTDMPDLVFVAIDANCRRLNQAWAEIDDNIEEPFQGRAVIACPDPHIERWYLADPESFVQVVGQRPRLGKKKCERGRYKSILASTIAAAGHPPTLGGIEFAQELVEAMDWYRAGKNDRSLRRFLGDAVARIKSS